MLGHSETAGKPGVLSTPHPPWNVRFFLYAVLLPKQSREAFLVNKIAHFITQVIQVSWTKGAHWGLAD